MNVLDLIKSRRSIRLFQQEPISPETLVELVDAARAAPCGANFQPLEYIIVDSESQKQKVFEALSWAGHVRPNRNPDPGSEPAAYIVVLVNTEIKKAGATDAAAAIMNILIAAWSMEIGSCWLGAIDREQIRKVLQIPENYDIDSVVALGKPAEQPIMEDAVGEDTKYYLDEEDTLHVPKRPLKAIAHSNKFGEDI